MKMKLLATAAALTLFAFAGPSYADEAAAQKWIDSEFQPSTLSKEEQMKEMQWFIKAAEPFKGMEINVLSEGIPTHAYESTVLTKAFEEITGIKVNHQILGEGEVVQAVQTQMQTNRNLYDAYVNDSDLIGTHSRLQQAVNLTDFMAGEGKDVTNPTLDLADFIGTPFTTGPDGKLYQLPDQQFANLYWFRKDWFDRPDLKEKFKAKYGYDLGVPVNWSAYEDIAAVLHRGREGNRRREDLWPHGLRQARPRPRLAHDRRLAFHGRCRFAWPAKRPSRSTNGASAWKRARATRRAPRSPAVAKPTALLRSMPSPSGMNGCANMRLRVRPTTTSTSRCRPSARATSPSRSSGTRPLPPRWLRRSPKATTRSTTAATPLWRMAPSPHGPYWKDGQKLGYQDVGSWTILKSTPLDRAQGGLALCPVRRSPRRLT